MASQVVLFVLLEVSERIYQREPFTAGLLTEGFSAELVIAVGLSALLIVLGHAAHPCHPSPATPSDTAGDPGSPRRDQCTRRRRRTP